MKADTWNEFSFTDLVDEVPRSGSVPKSAYLPSGAFPVIDQGATFVAGYTDDSATVVRQPLPLIIFGDHTRALKYVDFPFAPGADGTKFLAARPGIDPRFLYYALSRLDIPARGYNRHFKLLRESRLSAPPTEAEQRAIANVLSTLQATVTVREREVATLKELKAATMATLFREGLRGERLKRTEIGEIPETWDVVPLSEVVNMAQYGLSVRGERAGASPILRMNCQREGRVVFEDLQFVSLDTNVLDRYRLARNDLLFNRTNSYDLVGRTAIYDSNRNAVFASYLVRLRVRRNLGIPAFFNYYLNLAVTQARLKALATRGVSQSNISASKLKTLLVPLPPMVAQEEIATRLDALTNTVEIRAREVSERRALFSATLQLLMTGQLRVPLIPAA